MLCENPFGDVNKTFQIDNAIILSLREKTLSISFRKSVVRRLQTQERKRFIKARRGKVLHLSSRKECSISYVGKYFRYEFSHDV